MFTLNGINSGLDTQTLIDTLVQVQRLPKETQLQRQKNVDTFELSALGQLQGALNAFDTVVSDLSDGSSLVKRRATVSDMDVLGVTPSASSATGSYTFTVSALATNHQMATADFNSTDTFGTGTLKLSVGGEDLDLTLDSSNNTLEGIRDAINNAENNPGISAALINSGSQQRLLITADNTGVANTVTIDITGLTIGGGDQTITTGLSDLQTAADAEVTIGDPGNPNSIQVTHGDNTIEDLIDGVTLELKSVSATPVSVTVFEDESAASNAIRRFVAAYNDLVTTRNSVTSYSQEGGAAALHGDSQTRILSGILRSAVGDSYTVGSDTLSLAELGIITTQTGTLEIDESKFSAGVSTHFSKLESFFTGDNGLMSTLSETLDNYDSSTGLIKQRMDRLEDDLRDIDAETLELDAQMEKVRSYWVDQFLAMEEAMGQFNSSASYLTQALSSLNNINNNNNSNN
ncbi:flagellar hook-associated protein 2 [Elysia marginata]|uniref:Filament cap protein n=1 Tax=Elysia marginata TaxID=1093978 RepID=A0AAV4GCR8_9GAST|nr:flagellar hook-associated protein 2 [Elysia marginata]